MKKTIKQVYVALELCENDLKLLVGEYFNSRFNILKVEHATTSAICDFKVVDQAQLSKDIRKLVDSVSNKLGAVIEKVILLIPAYNFKRVPLVSTVVVESGHLSNSDVARAISNSLKSKVDNDVMVINPIINKYTINGISTRRMPINEVCDEAIVDIDLLCADKAMAIDYVTSVEKAGLKVLDIALNNLSISKEASLLEESLKQNIICLDIGRTCTYLTLLSKGKIISTEIVFNGIDNLVDHIKARYKIPNEDVIKLVKHSLNYEGEYLDDVVYAYNVDNKTVSITQRDLNDICEQPINEYVDDIITMCKPILEQGALLFITGEGQQIWPLVNGLKSKGECEYKSYYPDTIGVRDPSLTALYGSLFVYRDKALLYDFNVNCIDLFQYESAIEQKQFDAEGETITTKIKNLFKQYIESEDEE